MPRAVVVLPSKTYRAHDFVSAAESLGIDLVVASENPPPFDMGDRYLHIDCADPQTAADSITALGDGSTFDGVVAADDAGVLIAALAGTTLGLAANPPDAARATQNKHLLRNRLQSAEIPQPRFALLEPNQPTADETAQEVGFPLVVKPLSRTASQGVIRVDRPEDLRSTIDRVRRIIGDDDPHPLLLETYLPGDEVAVEGLVRNGELIVLAIFDKPDTNEGPSFPETILVTPSRLSAETQQECVRIAQATVRAIGLTHGPVHIELKVHDRVSVLEAAARSIGGLCSRSLNFGLMGTTLESLILRNAVGMDKPELHREQHASGVLMIPIPRSGILDSVEGVDEAREIPGVTGVDITIKIGSAVGAVPEGDRYLGFVFARADKPEDVESALLEAKTTIVVSVA